MAEGDQTFRRAVLVFTVGMLLPAVPVALARGAVVSALSYHAFLVTLAVGFGLAAFALVELWALDRLTFLFVAVVWPWVVFFAGLFVVLTLNEGSQIPRGPAANVFRALRGDRYVWDLPAQGGWYHYGLTFVLAGIGTVALSVALDRRSDPQTPGE